MAAPSYSYSLANGTTADASQVMQNFNDILNGVSDGTKDLSINALTCAGAATLNGNTTIGNSSGDDLTVTASLASSIPIKTTNSYNIGSSTLGLASIYLGANSQTVRILPSASMSATWTLTLPVSAGTANYALLTNGSGTTSWTEVCNVTGTQTIAGAKTFSDATTFSSTVTMGPTSGNSASRLNGYLELNSPDSSTAVVQYMQNGSVRGQIGTSSGTSFVAGSASGDMAIKGNSKPLWFSGDNGVAAHGLMSAAGIWTFHKQPAFRATGGTNSGLTAGPATVAWTEDFDVAGNFASSVFTAPAAGIYFFYTKVNLSSVSGASATSYPTLSIVQGGSYTAKTVTIQAGFTPVPNMSIECSAILSLSANEAVEVRFSSSSGTYSLDSGAYSVFYGYKLA